MEARELVGVVRASPPYEVLDELGRGAWRVSLIAGRVFWSVRKRSAPADATADILHCYDLVRIAMNLGRLLVQLQHSGIDVGSASSLAVNVARELKISVFQGDAEALFLRVVERAKGEMDFDNLRRLESVLDRHMVPPTAVVGTNELVCGIFPFVSHERVSYQLLSQERYLAQVTDILVRLHAGADQFVDSHRQFDVDALFGRLAGERWSDALFGYVARRYRPVIEARNSIPQHCDFTYVNLGADGDGTLRVFDWEDFGSIRYAGFDLATFVFSHLLHGGSLHLMANDPAAFTNKVRAEVGDRALARLGFTAEQFTEVFPGHLALFMGLKKEFGDAINRRLMPIWTQMMRSEQWQQVLGGRVD